LERIRADQFENGGSGPSVTACMNRLAALASILAAVGLSYPPEAFPTDRDPAVRKVFQKSHPCPTNGKRSSACPAMWSITSASYAPGVQIVCPACWQKVREAKKKDRLEAVECRRR
jgi:hypothetical protein